LVQSSFWGLLFKSCRNQSSMEESPTSEFYVDACSPINFFIGPWHAGNVFLL
jgi:hypothetical protein